MPLLGALLLGVISAGWAGWRLKDRLPPRPAAGAVKESGYRSGGWPGPLPPVRPWPAPDSQSSGEGWVFEIFSAPAISFKPTDGRFVLDGRGGEEDDTATAAGQEMDEAEPEPFPLKLVGFVGRAGSYLGTFENVRTGEHILAHAGQAVPSLGLTITELSVQETSNEVSESAPFNGWVGSAILRDDATGAETRLTDRIDSPPPAANPSVPDVSTRGSNDENPSLFP
jgi:hypothetical protein